MNLFVCRFLGCSLVALMLFSNAFAQSQTSAWSASGMQNKAKNKLTKAKHRLKDYRQHVENWGMDTSYNHTFLLGGKLNTDGWSGCIYLTKRKGYRTTNVWEMSFSEIKHEKQTKQKSTTIYKQFGNALPYVYGKINNLYTLQVGYGKEKLLLPAVMDGNISLGFRYCFGLSLAMLKPYYLKLVYTDLTNPTDTVHLEQHKYSRADSAQFLNTTRIFGAARWTKGLNEIEYVPGAYVEAVFTITPGKGKMFVQVITLGLNCSLYTKTLPIMADQKAYQWQVSLFAGLALGKRRR